MRIRIEVPLATPKNFEPRVVVVEVDDASDSVVSSRLHEVASQLLDEAMSYADPAEAYLCSDGTKVEDVLETIDIELGQSAIFEGSVLRSADETD